MASDYIISLQTVPCYIAGMGLGIVLLEEKIISKSLRDRQDIWVKKIIHIALACKCTKITLKLVWQCMQSKRAITLLFHITLL